MAMFGGGRFSKVAARRAGAGIEMNSSTHRRKHAHDIEWDNFGRARWRFWVMRAFHKNCDVGYLQKARSASLERLTWG